MKSVETEPFLSVHQERPRSLLHRGLFLCDPARLDTFYKGTACGRDIHALVGMDLEAICTQGIAVPALDARDSGAVVVRHHEAQHTPGVPTRTPSRGWIIETATGRLVLCSLDALLFWDPDDEEENGEPVRFARISVPPGIYTVELREELPPNKSTDGGNDIEGKDETGDPFLEFVLTPVEERPALSVEFQEDLEGHADEQTASPDSAVSGSVSAQPVTNASTTPVDEQLVRSILSRLSRDAFHVFIGKLFGQDSHYEKGFEELGEGVLYRQVLDSYGGSLHGAFLLQYLPWGLFPQPKLEALTEDPFLLTGLQQLKDSYAGVSGHFGMVSEFLVRAAKLRSVRFLSNLSGLSRDAYQDILLPQYRARLNSLGLYPPEILIGSYDSFIDLHVAGVNEAIKDLFSHTGDCISIEVGEEVQVRRFMAEQCLDAGVLMRDRCSLQPLYSAQLRKNQSVLLEFEHLIRSNASEANLERFLAANYREVFGTKYDRIETQIWLRAPELDPGGKERRFDVFLRNAVEGDWDLFELKRAVSLTTEYRDLPVLAAEVAHSIMQVKNYGRLLEQQAVKESLKRQGIEYVAPSLHLVIGRTPEMPADRWRWLLKAHGNDVKIITYDALLEELRIRFRDRANLFDGLGLP